MIQTSKEGKLLHIFISGITSACTNPDGLVTYIKQDMPLTVRMISTKGGFDLTDEVNSIPCEFCKGALFWFKMDNPTLSVKDLKDRHLVLNEYAPASVLTKDKEIEICLKIYSFKVLPKEDAKETKSPSKFKKLVQEKEMESSIELIRRAHLRRALSAKNVSELPGLEDILSGAGGKSSGKKGAVVPIVDVKVLEEEEKLAKKEDVIIAYNEIDAVEKALLKDVEILLAGEKVKEVEAGSEGNVERKKLLEAVATKVEDKSLVQLMRDRGVLRRASPSKASPKKKGKMPEDLKEAVKEAVKAHMKEKEKEKPEEKPKEKTSKRKKPEGKKPKEEKAEKKAAVEEEGKKAPAAKGKYPLRSQKKGSK